MPTEFQSKADYHQWLVNEVAAETLTMPKFRRHSRFALPISWRRLATYKRLLDEVFGASCNICGHIGRLEMAHLYYKSDSVPGDEHNGRGHLYRMREALENPERFFRLCSVCHGFFDHARRNGGVKFLKQLEGLIDLSEELANAD